jgi:fructosamine-3-kinase
VIPAAIPVDVEQWLAEQDHGEVTHSEPAHGGCINHGVHLHTRSGGRFFLKVNPSAPQGMFACEAEGLQALRAASALRVPQTCLVGAAFLLMEDLQPARRSPDYWTQFGHLLALQHQQVQVNFGFTSDNYLGSTPQPNSWEADGFTFFAEQRLLYQGRLAVQNQFFRAPQMRQLERLCSRLRDLIPAQPASLLHGDLWSGNALSDATGNPAVIDPAVYYGWAEAELGMTALFGGFPTQFYQAYQETRLLQPGWENRLEIYNLYHLLNHLNLFGMSYLADVSDILNRYE